MTTLDLDTFLKKWEKYVGTYFGLITQDNWPFFKKNGYLPKLPPDLELKKRLLCSGWDKSLIWADFLEDVLSKDDLLEFVKEGVVVEADLKAWNKELLEALEDEAWGDGSDIPWEKLEDSLDWFETLLPLQ